MAETSSERRVFLLRKLHSLSGVVPVGVFLVEHLWTNATALRGRAAFDEAVAAIQAMPFLPVIEVGGIFLPLAFHAFYGVYLSFSSRPNARVYPFARNWLYTAQRATGLLAFAFICFHLWEYRVQKWLFGMATEAFYGTLSERLSSATGGVPWRALLYIGGLGASIFHFANGLWGFCASWGILVTRAAQRRGAIAFSVFGAALFLLGLETVLHFATGAAPLLPYEVERSRSSTASPCPPSGERPMNDGMSAPAPSTNIPR